MYVAQTGADTDLTRTRTCRTDQTGAGTTDFTDSDRLAAHRLGSRVRGKAFGTAATRNGLEIGYETQSRNRARGEQVRVTYTTVYWYQTKSYIYGKSRRERTLVIRIRTDNVSLDVILVAAVGQSVSGFGVRIVLVACRGRTQRRHTAATVNNSFLHICNE